MIARGWIAGAVAVTTALSVGMIVHARNHGCIDTAAAASSAVRRDAGQGDIDSEARDLFQSLTSDGHADWESSDGWEDQCAVGLMNYSCELGPRLKKRPATFFTNFAIPPQFTASGLHGDILIPHALQSIYYSKSSAKRINDQKLSDRTVIPQLLDKKIKEGDDVDQMQIDDFQTDSKVVKTVWETLTPGPSANGTRYLATAYLYPPDGLTQTGSQLQSSQFDHALVDPSDPDNCRLEPPVDNQKVYTLGCFHHRPVSSADYDALSGAGGALQDFIFSHCNTGQCEMIMVGVHIMTRDTANWDWMTFWWQDKNDWNANPQMHWNQMFQEKATQTNTNEVANPYIEGHTIGMHTNCMSCHARAAFSRDHGPDLAQGNPGSSEADVLNPPCYFKDAIRTHFLWTVALHSYSDAPTSYTCESSAGLR